MCVRQKCRFGSLLSLSQSNNAERERERETEKLFHHVGTLYLKQTNLYIYICIFVAICDVLVLYDIALLLINIIPELQTTILFL